jgi:hypothetical protein
MMSILKPTLVLVILSSLLLCNYAWATEPPPRVGAVKEKAEPAPAPQPKKKPVKRRAVRQIVDGMPASAAPPAAYRPQLHPPGVTSPMPQPMPQPMPAPMPVPSAQVGSDYKGGVGTTLLSPQGRLCSDNGITVQCF